MAKFSFLLSVLVACLVALSATAFAPMSKYIIQIEDRIGTIGIAFREGCRIENWAIGG